jgi:transcriptional regulator with PAS, ATPase and Fis domain
MGIARLHTTANDGASFVEDYFDEILSTSSSGICIIDKKGIIHFVNKIFCELLNIKKTQVLKVPIEHLFFDQLVMQSLKSKKPMQGIVKYSNRYLNTKTEVIKKSDQFVGLKIIYDEHNEPIHLNVKSEMVYENPFSDVIGNNPRFVQELSIAKKVAGKNVTVLLRGESGTGKELIAKAIHENSARSKGPFVAINCAAIPESLMESELMGYEPGAFTGAIKRKIGQFELADGGTLFLDEIGDLPYPLQVKLLRVIQERVIRRIGGNESIPIDVRIIAATHQNIEQMMEDKCFREDLYFRLNVITVHLIALRERMDDLPQLVEFYVRKLERCHGLVDTIVSEEVMAALLSYDWKGNVRELRNVLERAILLMSDHTMRLDDLPLHISKCYKMRLTPNQDSLINFKGDGNLATLKEYENEIIETAMNQFGSFSSAARALGITHKTVAAKYRKLKIE